MAELKEIYKTSEKLIIWMHRSRFTQQDVARELFIRRQTLATKIKDNYWIGLEIEILKRLEI